MPSEQSFRNPARFGHHAAARTPPYPALPGHADQFHCDPDHYAGAVRLYPRGTIGAGLARLQSGSGAYIDYLTPGIILMTVCTGSAATALSINSDMSDGIIARFRTMAIARVAVLIGHVVSSVI